MKANHWVTVCVAFVLFGATACGSQSVPGPSTEPSVEHALLPSPLLDRCSQLNVRETLRKFGRRDILGDASFSTLDGMACGFDVPGPDSGTLIRQTLVDGLHPLPTLDGIRAQGGERLGGIGDGAVIDASGPVRGGQASTRIDFDLNGSRWTVEVYGPATGSDKNLVAIATALCGDILPAARRFGPLTTAEVLADPASPPAQQPLDAAVATVLGARSDLVSTVSFSRDYVHRSYHQNRDWASSDFGSSLVISLRGGAQSATPIEAVAAERVEYNEIVQNPAYLQTEAPSDRPVNGLGPGALVDAKVTNSSQGGAYSSYSYTFKRGGDLYSVNVGGTFEDDIGPKLFAFVKDFYSAGA